MVHTGYTLPWDGTQKCILIFILLSTARSRADAPLQLVSWCLLPGLWSITAALPWRAEDWRPQQTAILRIVVRKPRIGEAQCTVGPRLTQPSPGNISSCHEALLRTSRTKRNKYKAHYIHINFYFPILFNVYKVRFSCRDWPFNYINSLYGYSMHPVSMLR